MKANGLTCAAFAVCVGLAGCAQVSLPRLGLFDKPLAAGVQLMSVVPARERTRVAALIEEVLDSPRTDSRSWTAENGKASGVITPGTPLVVGLSGPGSVHRAPFDLAVDRPLETGLGRYRYRTNGNVRRAPDAEAARVTTLGEGTEVEVLGRDPQTQWLMVARGDQVIGYSFGPLLERVAASRQVLAGGPPVTPVYCRRFTSLVRQDDGAADTWQGVACRQPSGRWRLAPELEAGA